MTIDQQPFVQVPMNRTAMKWGAIMGFAGIIVTLVFYFTTGKMDSKNPFQMILGFAIIIGGLIMCVKEQRDELQNGYISFGRALGVAMLTVLFSSIISGFFTYVFLKFGAPEILQNMVTEIEDKMREQGQSDEQIEMSISMMSKMMQPGIITIMGVFMSALMSLVPALIIAAVMKKEQEAGF
ncbi:MAG: DUF4199 domain-containing protein [Bacteroidia bacterium]|nr:DUF4199 domain-containing protein [Bacteroidia bacterium]MBP7259846.1 DUF4199 domain-containing protein [Bacteroidia bacterium]MBP9179214.1 DUF4199 domain-containing protein [Bacteroidia bacterium]MBP9723515.1 DUF4199 domain-containing protein [Bacteroidia bacterium]